MIKEITDSTTVGELRELLKHIAVLENKGPTTLYMDSNFELIEIMTIEGDPITDSYNLYKYFEKQELKIMTDEELNGYIDAILSSGVAKQKLLRKLLGLEGDN